MNLLFQSHSAQHHTDLSFIGFKDLLLGSDVKDLAHPIEEFHTRFPNPFSQDDFTAILYVKIIKDLGKGKKVCLINRLFWRPEIKGRS
jgi:hypothetical protein